MARCGLVLAAGAILAASAGCTQTAERSDDTMRRARAAQLTRAIEEDAAQVPDEAQRERLTKGLAQVRGVLGTSPMDEVYAAPGTGAGEAPSPSAMFEPKSLVIGFFTQSKDFDGKPGQDGIEVCVEPLDQFGDPAKAVGRFRIEVFENRQHTTEPRGDRLGHWVIELLDAASNRKYYDQIDRSYVFPLMWQTPIAAGRSVIVQATFYPYREAGTGTEGGFGEKLIAQRVITIGSQ